VIKNGIRKIMNKPIMLQTLPKENFIARQINPVIKWNALGILY